MTSSKTKIFGSPALSDQGKLMSGTKSSLLRCLPGMPDPGHSPAAKEASVVVCNMSAIIHMAKPHCANVFGESHTEALATIPGVSDDQQHYNNRCCLGYLSRCKSQSQTRARRGETQGQRSRVSAPGLSQHICTFMYAKGLTGRSS